MLGFDIYILCFFLHDQEGMKYDDFAIFTGNLAFFSNIKFLILNQIYTIVKSLSIYNKIAKGKNNLNNGLF